MLKSLLLVSAESGLHDGSLTVSLSDPEGATGTLTVQSGEVGLQLTVDKTKLAQWCLDVGTAIMRASPQEGEGTHPWLKLGSMRLQRKSDSGTPVSMTYGKEVELARLACVSALNHVLSGKACKAGPGDPTTAEQTETANAALALIHGLEALDRLFRQEQRTKG